METTDQKFSSNQSFDEILQSGLMRQITAISNTTDAIALHFNCGHKMLLSPEESQSLLNSPQVGEFFPCLHNGCLAWLDELNEEQRQSDSEISQQEFDEWHERSHSGENGSCYLPGIGEVTSCSECGCLLAGGNKRCFFCEPRESVSLNEAHQTIASALENNSQLLFSFQGRIENILYQELKLPDASIRTRVASLILASIFSDIKDLV